MDLILPNSEKEISEEKRKTLMELRKGFLVLLWFQLSNLDRCLQQIELNV